ncbi:Exodeoxyribonuclease 7 small subunit [Maioricimonas rarisocia]|uniref:Exodeoxyribonuclease 7 small subunit n=1 Tax=Maioricimonas rarisocia TaxID=2528026 RepID=A0A517Z6C5_9PLAN|nr:exodeoxyribonuclease VII small subunit [Maioricimonas rarisocia]QDU38042.1 Exodeoxyribonuclease 7 small subunit [Maioricimonas rarisocia]
MAKKKARSGKKDETSDPGFEDALAELHDVVRDLEEGELPLEESLQRFERGIALMRVCRERLAKAEQQIQMLTGLGPDGAETAPFDAEATWRGDESS